MASASRDSRVVLIATSTSDRQTCSAVARCLESLQCDVLWADLDAIARGDWSFSGRIANGRLTLRFDDKYVAPDEIAAAWWRKPQHEVARPDPLVSRAIERESLALYEGLLACIPEARWLNGLFTMKVAASRFRQLLLAHEAGFDVPETLVTNEWAEVAEVAQAGDVAMKLPNGVLQSADGARVMYTQRLGRDAVAALARDSTCFPGIYQPFVEKRREWRVTVVGDEVFEAAVETAPGASTDWRAHQFTGDVRFRSGRLSDDVRGRCVSVVRRSGLRFGAIDLVETPEGRVVFLELNPNGQYFWLEHLLDLPISAAIARELKAVATSRHATAGSHPHHRADHAPVIPAQ